MNTKKNITVLTGAGISAESGLSTFRDSGGLWAQYRIEDVASPEAWATNPERVLEFYNQRRKHCLDSKPNRAHQLLAKLEKYHNVRILTQNVDDLHERAGSTSVLHLHGELLKSRSTKDPNLVYPCSGDIKIGDLCELGTQLRPHIVWFGEEVPMIPQAEKVVQKSDILIIIGTSLQVFPVAALIYHAPPDCPIYIIDPQDVAFQFYDYPVTIIRKRATEGMEELFQKLTNG